jgi:hypothetical protein
MKDNNYDHIKDYLKGRIKDPKDPEVRGLIADFALLWNQYERTIFEGEHHIGDVQKKIKSFKLDRMANVKSLYDRFKNYVEYRRYDFTYEGLTDMFKIRIIKEVGVDKNNEPIFTRGEIEEESLRKMIEIDNPFNEIYLLLFITAKVRNNMFHGTKGAWELPKQKELFRICNETLMNVLEETHMQNV